MKRPLLLLALFVATPCSAGSLAPWLLASGAFNTYAMDAVNDDIAGINETLAPATMDEIGSGIGYGLSVGADLDRWSFALGYERLPASSHLEFNGTSSGFAYDIPADLVLARAVYRVSMGPRFGYGIGIGVGIASVSGAVGSSQDPIARKARPSTNAVIYGPSTSVSGTSACFEGFIEGDVALGGKFGLVPAVGYRAAKIDAGVTAGASSGSETLDFSGLSARVGVRFAF